MVDPTPGANGIKFKVLLTDGLFQLIDTSGNNLGREETVWVWHMCDEYERHMTNIKGHVIGLMSNKELYWERCQYCQARIPKGMTATWKMMNWQHSEEFSKWKENYGE